MKKLLLTCVTFAVLLVPAAPQAMAAHFVGGGVFVGPAFGWGWYGPYWGPYPYRVYGGYYYGPATGAVKFDTSVKNAEVFINGAYAGTVGKLKTLHLRPGSYSIELRAPGYMHYAERIYVAPGKTLHVKPDLRVQAQR
jgi:hypothetical protein